MFLDTYIYLLNVSIITILFSYVKYNLVDDNVVNKIQNKINDIKKNKRVSIESQNSYLDLIDQKNIEIGKSKFYGFGLIFVAIVFALLIKGTQPVYFFGIKVGFIFVICYVVLFSLMFNYIMEKVGIKNKPL